MKVCQPLTNVLTSEPTT